MYVQLSQRFGAQVASVMMAYRRRVSEDEKETKLHIENQENVLILFREFLLLVPESEYY